MMTTKAPNKSPEIRNKRAFHDYTVGERFEAGMALTGAEVKSLRDGHAQIHEAFVRPNRKGELILFNANIAEYKFGDAREHECTRQRQLLLHKREIRKIIVSIERERLFVFPLKIYFKHGLAKIEIAICKSKKLFDKRETLKRKDALREAERILSSRMRGR